MTKEDIIKTVSDRTGVDKIAARVVVDETFNIMKEALREGLPIFIRGLFTLQPTKRAAKKARNISKGITVTVPARIEPKAQFAKELREEMRKLPVE